LNARLYLCVDKLINSYIIYIIYHWLCYSYRSEGLHWTTRCSRITRSCTSDWIYAGTPQSDHICSTMSTW